MRAPAARRGLRLGDPPHGRPPLRRTPPPSRARLLLTFVLFAVLAFPFPAHVPGAAASAAEGARGGGAILAADCIAAECITESAGSGAVTIAADRSAENAGSGAVTIAADRIAENAGSGNVSVASNRIAISARGDAAAIALDCTAAGHVTMDRATTDGATTDRATTNRTTTAHTTTARATSRATPKPPQISAHPSTANPSAPSATTAANPAAESSASLHQAQEMVKDLDLTALRDAITRLEQPTGLLPDLEAMLTSMVRGEFTWDSGSVLNTILWILIQQAVRSLPTLLRIVSVAILCSVLVQMRVSYGDDGVAEVGNFVTYLLVVMPVLYDFTVLIGYGRTVINAMTGLMNAIFPVLLTLLTAVGGVASAGVFQPASAMVAGVAGSVLRDVVLTLVLFAAALSVLNHLSTRIKLDHLQKLIRSLCKWTLGVSFTVMLGILTIQGVASSSFDGISIRTAKYAIDNFVPIVGGMFADTVDTLVGCSVLVKNAVGVSGLLLLVGGCIIPAAKIFGGIVCYRLAAAIIEPFGEQRIVGALNDLSDVLVLLLVTVLTVVAMCFVLVALMVAAGNMTVMLR